MEEARDPTWPHPATLSEQTLHLQMRRCAACLGHATGIGRKHRPRVLSPHQDVRIIAQGSHPRPPLIHVSHDSFTRRISPYHALQPCAPLCPGAPLERSMLPTSPSSYERFLPPRCKGHWSFRIN